MQTIQTVNTDTETGIHYGAIAHNSISSEAFDDVWTNARDLSHEYAVSEMKAQIARLESENELAEFLEESFGSWRYNPTEQASEITTDCGIVWGDELSPEAVESIWNEIEQTFNDNYQDGGERNWLYEGDGYKLTKCLDYDVFVLKSEFFTFARPCSPCVPNAGNLDSWEDGTLKTYCLGHEFFEGGKAPYPVYSVLTGELA